MYTDFLMTYKFHSQEGVAHAIDFFKANVTLLAHYLKTIDANFGEVPYSPLSILPQFQFKRTLNSGIAEKLTSGLILRCSTPAIRFGAAITDFKGSLGTTEI